MARRDDMNAGIGEVAPAPERVEPKKRPSGGKEKRPNVFKRFGRFLKEMVSELKKVTWPAIPKVVKQTGIVVVVVLIFLAVLMAIDSALAALLGLLTETGA